MNNFKKMKFWIEKDEPELYNLVCSILKERGYQPEENIDFNVCAIETDNRGEFAAACTTKGSRWYVNLADHEEINIDWMRSPLKRKTVMIEGSEYYEEEVKDILDMLKKIKPIEMKA